MASSLSLGVGYLFLVGSSVNFFVDGCSAVSYDSAVFMRGGELKSFYSAILLLQKPEGQIGRASCRERV